MKHLAPARSKPPRPEPGFTLTEVLIVISIVAVLALISLQVTTRFKDRAHAATCGSNMRQLAALGQLFASEHNGKLPRLHVYNAIAEREGYIPGAIPQKDRISNNPAAYFWPDLLSAYGDVTSICSCPKLKQPATSGPGGGKSDRYPLGIGINYGPMAPNYQDPKDESLTWTRSSKVPDPARVVWFADAGGDVTGPWNERKDQPNTGSVFFRGWNQQFQGVMPRHGGKVNVCFADGHVVLANPEDIDWGRRDTSGQFIGYTDF
ncbi:prepilin-type N-terminal cleavage/methylation domain-containing protein [Akkermansiaceae bacterium]|nr:prepilin-type N-terminal cleavage/methylation domain-containing protein [Akkermansiaceae bacterium]